MVTFIYCCLFPYYMNTLYRLIKQAYFTKNDSAKDKKSIDDLTHLIYEGESDLYKRTRSNSNSGMWSAVLGAAAGVACYELTNEIEVKGVLASVFTGVFSAASTGFLIGKYESFTNKIRRNAINILKQRRDAFVETMSQKWVPGFNGDIILYMAWSGESDYDYDLFGAEKVHKYISLKKSSAICDKLTYVKMANKIYSAKDLN